MNIDEEIPAIYAEDYKMIQHLNGWVLCEMMSEAVIEIPDLRARVPPFSGLAGVGLLQSVLNCSGCIMYAAAVV